MEQISLFDIGLKDINNTNIERTSEKIIKASDMRILKIESFAFTTGCWHYGGGRWHVVTATIAFVEGNLIYLKEFSFYPFLYKFQNEQDAYRFYISHLEKLREHGKRRETIQCELDIHHELEDMYFCEKNKYGCFEYWNNKFNPENTWVKRIKSGLD